MPPQARRIPKQFHSRHTQTDPKRADVRAMLAVLSLANAVSGPAYALSEEYQAILDLQNGIDLNSDALDSVPINEYVLSIIQNNGGPVAIVVALLLALEINDRFGGGGGGGPPTAGSSR